MRVIIVRGLPGSGKSTYIRQMFPNAAVCSADHYFENEEGEYIFDPSKIGEAHKECQTKFLEYLQGYDFDSSIIVDNTNLSLWEMAYYVGLANVFGVPVEIHRLDCPVDICIERNVHGVPADKIRMMAKRMEKVPPFFAKEIAVSGI